MSLPYCYDCLEVDTNCECGSPSNRVIYGELRRAYLQGYRDHEQGKEEDI